MTHSESDASGQLGWVVSWAVPRQVGIANLRSSLVSAGLDPELAGDMTTQNALRRALRDMNESRVIRKLRVEGENVFFQITHEDREETQISYWKEAEVCLDGSGVVTCTVPSTIAGAEPEAMVAAETIAGEARQLLQDHLAKRLTSDLTRLLQRIFDKNKGDLIPIREQGGAYFVPESCGELVNQSRTLLNAIGGNLRSFAVRLGCGDTKESVAESLSEYLGGLVKEFRDSLEGINAESRKDVLLRRAERIGQLRQKLDTYRGLLSGYAETLTEDINQADAAMLAAIAGPASAPEDVEATASEPAFA